MREEEAETMVDEAELSNQAVGQAVGVGDIQNFFSALKTNDFSNFDKVRPFGGAGHPT